MLPTQMPRRALLIFADDARLDLARRRLPVAALPLLQFPSLECEAAIAADVHVFSSGSRAGQGAIQFHRQHGADFAARFENAIDSLHALGYEEIVAIGRDCPSLRAEDIARAFAELREKQLVLGPDHRGGCYLIAFRACDRALLRNIRWKQNTDCAQLCARCDQSGAFLLAVKQDLDSWADLKILARGRDWLAEFASSLLRFISFPGHGAESFVHLALQFVRVRGQMPPPAFAG